jgi:lipopolysaccharide biosynthesis regulator YciM
MWQQLWQGFIDPGTQGLFLAISLLAVFALGLLIGRATWIKRRKEDKSLPGKGDRAFFKGVQYILSNDRDQAIEEFTKSVQINSDTIETYVTLGNLYRSRGDFERAIRIRQSIILRPNIDDQIKIRTLFDLGLDYRKGGIINRALDTFLEVLSQQPTDLDTLREVEQIYEEVNDWENAFDIRKRIAKLTKGDHNHILAHHQTEIGKVRQAQGQYEEAESCFMESISIDRNCIDAYLHLGDLYFDHQDYAKAITTWKEVVSVAPKYTFLAYRRLEGAYAKMENLEPVEEFLKDCAKSNSDAFTHLALAQYLINKEDYSGALLELNQALDLDPVFWEAYKLKGEIYLRQNNKEEALNVYREFALNLKTPYLTFQCAKCGFQPMDLQWRCPQCRSWDTIHLTDNPSPAVSLPRAITEGSDQKKETKA